MLTTSQCICFPFQSVWVDKQSPFKKSTNLGKTVKKLNTSAWKNTVIDDITDDEEERPESFYLFGFLYFSGIFSRFYSKSVAVHSTTEGVTSEEAESAKVIIVVGSEPPQSGHHHFGRCNLSCKLSVCCGQRKRRETHPSSMRFGTCDTQNTPNSGSKNEMTRLPRNALMTSLQSWSLRSLTKFAIIFTLLSVCM